ncbi:hypothetical protein [Bacillus cereus]|uniref:hypothetical protein n=1 Tax=Bacillus cereus TaxID=1396 RepID=UPI000B443DD6|nr:hypothetical protein [Bacillus cereus]
MACKRCRTVNTKLTDLIKLTNLCYLKTDELKALDCLRKATSAFLLDRHAINFQKIFFMNSG